MSSASYRRNGGGVKRARGQTAPADKAYVNTHPRCPPAPPRAATLPSPESLPKLRMIFTRSLCVLSVPLAATPPFPRGRALPNCLWLRGRSRAWRPLPRAPRSAIGCGNAPLFPRGRGESFISRRTNSWGHSPLAAGVGPQSIGRRSGAAGHSALPSSHPACTDAIFRGPSPRVPCATTNEACILLIVNLFSSLCNP